MSALTIERKTPKLGQDVLPSFPTNLGVGMALNAKCFGGGLVCLATSGANAGFAVAGSATAGLVALGVAEKTVDNTIAGATAGGLTIIPRQGVFLLNNSTGIDLITANNVGADCYIVDDNTVSLSNSGGTRPRAGVIVSVDSGTPGQGQPTGVWVLVGITGSSAAYGDPLTAALDLAHGARNVVTTALAAYTKTAGVITANANGAWAVQDGITNVVGDVVLLPDGIAAAAADAGPWQITALGSAGAKFSLSRPSDWASGSFGLTNTQVNIAEGTLFAGTQWYHATAGNFTVDTTAMRLVPRQVTQSITLVAGTATIANVPVLSATKTGMASIRTTANTTSLTTGGYHPVGAIVPGALGTASIVFDATVAAGSINVADISILAVTIFN